MAITLDGTNGIDSPDFNMSGVGVTYPLVSGTITLVSGTSTLITGIPSWVKRITVMYKGVTLSAGVHLIQIGSGSVSTTGYTCAASGVGASSVATSSVTNGFQFGNTNSAANGIFTLTLVDTNTWTGFGAFQAGTQTNFSTGISPTLVGALDRINITSSTGLATLSAGSVNIMYE